MLEAHSLWISVIERYDKEGIPVPKATAGSLSTRSDTRLTKTHFVMLLFRGKRPEDLKRCQAKGISSTGIPSCHTEADEPEALA